MPQITMIEDAWNGATLLAAGSVVNVSTELADNLVGAGKAKDTTGYQRLRVASTVAGVVDADGSSNVVGAAGLLIRSADLATTTGKPDTLYEVSDGDNRGAKIIWAVPEGASVATWCWWLWPQSAFEI